MVWEAKSEPPVDLEKAAAGKKEAFVMDPWREKVLITYYVVCTMGLGAVDHDFHRKAEVSVPMPDVDIL
uniref:Uncharacterized protein n=1 Tax=Arundo donax TaxID=35708 RepID=A0A0A9AZL0_ARUDO